MLYYTFTFYIEHLYNFQHKGYHSLLITTITINQTLHVPTLIHKHPLLPRSIALGSKTIPIMSRPIHASASPHNLPPNPASLSSSLQPQQTQPPNNLHLQSDTRAHCRLRSHCTQQARAKHSSLLFNQMPFRIKHQQNQNSCRSSLAS